MGGRSAIRIGAKSQDAISPNVWIHISNTQLVDRSRYMIPFSYVGLLSLPLIYPGCSTGLGRVAPKVFLLDVGQPHRNT